METNLRTSVPSLSSGANAGPIVVAPASFAEAMEFAKQMSLCSFVPKHLRNRPADCLAVCLQALRWSMDPFSVAQKTYFVSEGSAPGYEAQLISAVVHSRAPLDGRLSVAWEGDGNGLTCTVTGKFRGDPQPKLKTCRIANIKTKNSPLWTADPEQQLAYYTVRAWARLYCPDIIMGVYTREELVEADNAVGPDAAKDVTPPISRLDALERVITNGAGGSAASSGGHPPVADYVGAELGLPPAPEPQLLSPDGEVLTANQDGLGRFKDSWLAHIDRIDIDPATAVADAERAIGAAKELLAAKPKVTAWLDELATQWRRKLDAAQ